MGNITITDMPKKNIKKIKLKKEKKPEEMPKEDPISTEYKHVENEILAHEESKEVEKSLN